MGKVDDYRKILIALCDWDSYLLEESCLPGPRANLELAEAVAREGDLERFKRYLDYSADQAPYGSALEFLPVCGVLGLGRLLAEGRWELLEVLRSCASDPRWRLREGVAIALQKLGDVDMDKLLEAMAAWQRGNLLEKRASAAAVCEPGLLKKSAYVRKVLDLLDQIMEDILQEKDRRKEDFRVLRKAMGYCWSVAVAADPETGKGADGKVAFMG